MYGHCGNCPASQNMSEKKLYKAGQQESLYSVEDVEKVTVIHFRETNEGIETFIMDSGRDVTGAAMRQVW